MSTDTRDTPDNPYRKRDPWGARPAIPQVFTVTAAPAPMRRVFKAAPQATAPTPAPTAPAADTARDRLHLTPVAEPYDEPPPARAEPPRAEAKPVQPAPDLVTTRMPPFAGPAPLPASDRARRTFVGAAPPSTPVKPEPPKVAERAAVLAPFARTEPTPRPTPAPQAAAPAAPQPRPAPKPTPEAKRPESVAAAPTPAPAPRPVPAVAVEPPVGGFGFQRLDRARRARRALPRGLLAASLIVLAGIAAVAAVVVLKPWDHASAVDTLAAQSAKPPAPLTITPAADPFAANATTPQPQATPSSAPAPVRTATASLVPHPGPAASSATAAPPPVAAPGITPTLIDVGAPAPNAAVATQPAASPTKAGPSPITIATPPAADSKPAAVQPEPAKAPPPKPAGETVATSHLPDTTVGPHQ